MRIGYDIGGITGGPCPFLEISKMARLSETACCANFGCLVTVLSHVQVTGLSQFHAVGKLFPSRNVLSALTLLHREGTKQ